MNAEILNTLFAAGAHSALDDSGLSKEAADAVVAEVCKAAAARRVRWGEGEDDEDETWWSRNKGWVIPALVGYGAFVIGADAGRNGRPDRSHLSNAGSLLWERAKALAGVPDSALWRSMTDITPNRASVNAKQDHSKTRTESEPIKWITLGAPSKTRTKSEPSGWITLGNPSETRTKIEPSGWITLGDPSKTRTESEPSGWITLGGPSKTRTESEPIKWITLGAQ